MILNSIFPVKTAKIFSEKIQSSLTVFFGHLMYVNTFSYLVTIGIVLAVLTYLPRVISHQQKIFPNSKEDSVSEISGMLFSFFAFNVQDCGLKVKGYIIYTETRNINKTYMNKNKEGDNTR